MSTTETERYVRMTLLTFEGGIWIGKKILFRELDRTPGSPTLDALLLSKKQQLTQKRNRREITKRQFEALFPINGADTDVEEWDLSLIIKIVLFLFEHSLPGQESYDLNEILRIRNEVVCHARYPSVQDQEFYTHWTQLTMSVCGLASTFDESTRRYASDLIQRLSRGPLDLQSSIERVAQLCRNDELMENMLASLATLQRGLNEVATGVVDANKKLDDVLAGVRELIRIHETGDEGQCRVEIPMLNSTVVLSGKKEDVVKLAEDVLRKVIQSAIDKVPDQADDENVRIAVKQFLADLDSNGGTAESTEPGSIILKILCKTLTDLERMLALFNKNGNKYRLVGIENALSAMFQEELKIELVMPEDTLDSMKSWIDTCLSEQSDTISDDGAHEHTRSINLGIRCDSAQAAIDVMKYLGSAESANRLNQIAEAVSEVVGDRIKIEAVPDVEGFSRALSANILSIAPSSQRRETHTANEQPPVENVPRQPIELTTRPLRNPWSSKEFDFEDKKIKSEGDSTDDGAKKDKIIEESSREEALLKAYLHESLQEQEQRQHFGATAANLHMAQTLTDDEIQMDPVARRLRCIGDDLHAHDPVVIPPGAVSLTLSTFRDVMRTTLRDGISWGRIVALTFFGGQVVLTSLRETLTASQVSQTSRRTALVQYLSSRLVVWTLITFAEEIHMNGGLKATASDIARSPAKLSRAVGVGLGVYIGYRIVRDTLG